MQVSLQMRPMLLLLLLLPSVMLTHLAGSHNPWAGGGVTATRCLQGGTLKQR